MDKIVICVLFLGLFGIAQSIISGKFERKFGWIVNIGWTRNSSDELFKDVYVMRNENEPLFAYSPIKDGPVYNTSVIDLETFTNISCQYQNGSSSGNCSVKVEVRGPPKNIMFTSHADWVSPSGKVRRNTTVQMIIGEASRPTIEIHYVTGKRAELECSSSGVPAPVLVWFLHPEYKEIKVTRGRRWNNETKLYDSWSVFKPNDKTSDGVRLTCAPRQQNRRCESVYGEPRTVQMCFDGEETFVIEIDEYTN